MRTGNTFPEVVTLLYPLSHLYIGPKNMYVIPARTTTYLKTTLYQNRTTPSHRYLGPGWSTSERWSVFDALHETREEVGERPGHFPHPLRLELHPDNPVVAWTLHGLYHTVLQ